MPQQAGVTAAAIIGKQSLKLLREASKFVPVPGLGVAAAVALEILDTALAAEDNKDSFIAIGKDACTIMVTVVQRVNRSATGSAPPIDTADLQRDTDSLLTEMNMIEKIVKKHAKRGFLKRMVFSLEDTDVVQQCQGRLDHALKLFGLQSDIELRQQMALLNHKMDKMSEKLDQAPQMPQPSVQSNPSPQSLQPTLQSRPPSQSPQPAWPEQLTPSYPTPPQPSTPSYPTSPQPSTPSCPPSPQPGQLREDRKAARRARREERGAQQAIGLPGLPPDSTFSNVQNHLSPAGSISYSYVNGNAVTTSRDDSFNVSGTGNSISIAFTR